jgi:hypothetical protein
MNNRNLFSNLNQLLTNVLNDSEDIFSSMISLNQLADSIQEDRNGLLFVNRVKKYIKKRGVFDKKELPENRNHENGLGIVVEDRNGDEYASKFLFKNYNKKDMIVLVDIMQKYSIQSKGMYQIFIDNNEPDINHSFIDAISFIREHLENSLELLCDCGKGECKERFDEIKIACESNESLSIAIDDSSSSYLHSILGLRILNIMSELGFNENVGDYQEPKCDVIDLSNHNKDKDTCH